MTRGIRLVLIIVAVVAMSSAFGADWPRFGGPSGDCIAPDTGINKDWNQKPPKVLWTVPLGDRGYAGPSVADGKVFIIDHAGSEDIVRALNLQTGEEVWRFAYADTSKHSYGYARATPTYAGGKLYTLSRLGLLHCLNAGNGNKIWSVNIKQRFSGQGPKWNYAASPIVDGNRVIVLPGGNSAGMAALNKDTGETIWTGGRPGIAGYATPVVATIQGIKQYIAFTGDELYGVRADDGSALWKFPWVTKHGVNAAMPIVQKDYVFITSGYGHGCSLLQITPQGPDMYWQSKAIVSHFNSPVFYKSHVFGTGDQGGLVCLNSRDNKVMWTQPISKKGGLVAVDGVIIVVSDSSGDVVMINASPDSYQELGRIKPLGGKSWSPPIIAHGKLIVRNEKAIVCLDLM